MNYWHKKAVELRRTYDADYVDNYDYTYGGTYSGFTISDEAMEENAKIAFDAFALTTAGTSRVAVKAPSTVTKATTVVPKASSRIKVNLQLFAKKNDIKQIESIAKEFKMSPQMRRGFGDYVESLKELVPNNKNFTYQQLREIAKEFLGVD